MAKNGTKNGSEKAAGPPKSFMTVGPTLHYSHANVHRCWALAVAVLVAACLFWSKILTGTALTLDYAGLTDPVLWRLGRFTVSPLSIYEYPWQILVLGLLMGIMASSGVLISQLLSFRYSLPMVMAVAFLARLPLFAIFVLVSCIAVACRPLRFRSRFISLALCMTPQLVYWGVFGGSEVDPIKWGFSYAPWLCAWLTSIGLAGAVIAVGHYTRYRPGLVWSISGIGLLAAVLVFQGRISFAELDYQLYVAGNNPEEVSEFHDHHMSAHIDKALEDATTRSYLEGLFYPTEPILLREELKRDIQTRLGYNRWPLWFNVPEQLKYQEKRTELTVQYELFISKWPLSRRMPIALYYKAVLNEYSPDIKLFGQKETLRFHSDYPHTETVPVWLTLYERFPQSAEALEARWRYATHLAGLGRFDESTTHCDVAEVLLEEHLKLSRGYPVAEGRFLTAFAAGPETVMTPFKLRELQRKLRRLRQLISDENRTDSAESKDRLARFVILNPYSLGYSDDLDVLLSETKEGDPLRDNILMAKIMLISDTQLMAEQLKGLGEEYPDTDGGIQALYELGVLKVGLWKEADSDDPEDKQAWLADARAVLTSFTAQYPQSIFSEQAQALLENLPATE